MNLYTIVTNDEFELPVKSDIRVREVAEFLNTNVANVHNIVFNPRKKSKYKVIISGKVVVDRRLYEKRYRMTHDRTEYFKQYYLNKTRGE